MRLSELAAALGAELVLPDESRNASATDITGVAAHAQAGVRQLVFAESEAALARANASSAGAVVTSSKLAGSHSNKPMLLVAHPKLAFARAAELLSTKGGQRGTHASAEVAVSASLGDSVYVGPNVVIDEDAVIGAHSRIDAGVVIGPGVRIGKRCHLYPRVVVYPGTELGDGVVVHAGAVLGSDGFGYVRDHATGEYMKFPQQGRLVIEDGVEIGANTTIDRGALGRTRIGKGTKLDNMVHVGHNCDIGERVVIAAQTGISGSVTIEDDCVIGGQVGFGDHIRVLRGAVIGSKAGRSIGKMMRSS